MDKLGYVRTAAPSPDWALKLRNFLAEFSDFFSHFNQGLPSNYRHDRCERSVHMRLYSMNKRHFATIFLLFVFSLGVLIIVGLTGPSIREEFFVNASTLNKSDFSLQSGPFILKTSPLSSFNQHLWLTVKYLVDKTDNSKFELSFTTHVQLLGYDSEDSQEKIYRGVSRNHSVALTCSSGECDEISLLHLNYLVHPYYIVNIRTYGLESIQFKIANIEFRFVTYNSAFTQLQIWFKFAFLLLSFLATCSFAYSLRKFSMFNWSMEQRWMTLLLPFLILYNNPIFPLNFLVSSWIPGTLDIFFQSTFLASLLLFWLCTYHGVRQIKRKFTLFYFPKILLVGCLWFVVVFFLSWQRFSDLNDPTGNTESLKFKVITATLAVFYLLYLIYLIIRAFAELRSMPYFDLRLKFVTSLLFMLIIVSIVVIVTRPAHAALFGIGFFQSLSPYPTSMLEFVVLYGMVNLHLIAMAFVYSPSSNAFYESHFKDNPALSMLNDSEDEVVYGEEISLTSSKPAKSKYDSDDDAFN